MSSSNNNRQSQKATNFMFDMAQSQGKTNEPTNNKSSSNHCNKTQKGIIQITTTRTQKLQQQC